MRNPITDLVEKRQRAQYGRFFVESCTLVGIVMTLELTGLAVFEAKVFKWVALLLLVGIPALAGVPMARFMAALRREHLLDAIRITALQPKDVVDGMAWAAVRAVLPSGLVVAVFLLASSHSPQIMLWGPAMLGLTLVASYLAQCVGRRGFRAAAIFTLVGLAALPANPFCGVMCLLAGGWLARSFSLRDLEMQQAPPVIAARAAVRGRWGFRNLVMMRELARAFHHQGGRWVLLAMHDYVGLPMCLYGIAIPLIGWFGPDVASAVALVSLFVLQPLRAAWRSGVALVLEKDRGTLEMLYQSPTTSQEYVDGWALSAMVPTAVETVLALPLALWAGATLGVGSAVTVDLAVLIALSAYLGIMMSSVAPNRTIAHRFLHFWTALYVGFGVVPIALAAFTASVPTGESNLVYPPLLGLACIALFREWTITRVQDDPVLTGFSPR